MMTENKHGSPHKKQARLLIIMSCLLLHFGQSSLRNNFLLFSSISSSNSDNISSSHNNNNNKCLWKMGNNGTWKQDWNFSKEFGQYSSPWAVPDGPYGSRVIQSFKPSDDAPFLWPSSWRWYESNEDGADCQVDAMTHHHLCKVLAKLKIHRILFFGDSLTGSMHQSFSNLIGKSNFLQGETPVFHGGNSSFICNVENPTGNNSAIEEAHIVHMRFGRDTGGNAFPDSERGEYLFDNETHAFLNGSSDRTLSVFNIGAHYHNFSHYKEDMDIMLKLLSDLQRPQDLYIFRATSPGHDGCMPRSRKFNWTHGTRITPLSSYSEYHLSSPHRYDWDKFEFYNEYTQKLLQKRQNLGEFPHMEFLNIFNMTVLRHDAHTAPADCLHFYSCGPVDWWNHLLFSNLRYMVT